MAKTVIKVNREPKMKMTKTSHPRIYKTSAVRTTVGDVLPHKSTFAANSRPRYYQSKRAASKK